MITFFEKFMIEGFIKGDYKYGFIHLFSVAFLFFSILITILLFKNKDEKYIHQKLKIIAYTTLTIYFLRRGVDVYLGKNIIKAFWPFYICNVNTIFLSLYLIFDIKKGKDFFIITGIMGSILMFVVPDGIFNDKYLTLQMLDSLLSHYFIIYVPIVLLATKAYVLDIKRSYIVIIGLLLVTINVEFLQPILINESVDYLFLDGTLPFTIKGVNQFFILFGTTTLYVYLVYFFNYLYINSTILQIQKESSYQ